jgi:1-acyl-sn-glycerol-3-phosphate acyltransferase
VRKGIHFDTAWARRPFAMAVRELILMGILGPLIEFYTRPRVYGLRLFDGLKPPVVFAANHSSHLDTPSILRSLPKKWRRKTATVAAADYFYANRIVGSLVTLSFGAVPIERKGGMSKTTSNRLDRLIDERWNILLYPEGTRSRSGAPAELKTGAAYIAVANSVPIVPIYLTGTHEAMPVGASWPIKHPVHLRFGDPLYPSPGEDHRALTERLKAELMRLRLASVSDS